MNDTKTILVNPETPEFLRWQDACVKLYENHMEENYPNNTKGILLGDFGIRYVQMHLVGPIDSQTGRPQSNSAWAFIDRRNGDVLKPASWKKPAKHARGNIFDADGGMKLIGPYGPAYLRGMRSAGC